MSRKGGEAFALTWNIHENDKNIKEKTLQFFLNFQNHFYVITSVAHIFNIHIAQASHAYLLQNDFFILPFSE